MLVWNLDMPTEIPVFKLVSATIVLLVVFGLFLTAISSGPKTPKPQQNKVGGNENRSKNWLTAFFD